MAVSKVPFHGGNVHAAARELRKPIESILDFSASINPLGPSPRVLHALDAVRGLIHHYPDPDCSNLKRAIHRRWHIRPERIVVGNGSTELIDLIPRALSIRSAVILGPTYGEYRRAVHAAGGRTTSILAKQTDAYRPPLKQVIPLLRHRRGRAAIDAVFICHPNSPTGRVCQREELHALIHAADRAGVWVVLDESFIEYCAGFTCVQQLDSYSRLIILRSFTKFYALPGLRIGYSASSPSVAGLLKRIQPPWSVNTMAQQAAEAAIGDERHARRCLAYVERERARLQAELASLDGMRVTPSFANFLLVEVPRSFCSSAVAAELRRQGILIRDCSRVEGCTRRTIRIAVRGTRDNERLVAALKKLLRR